MSYKQLISQMINNSHMTLRGISDKAKEKGVSIDPSYISKLQTGKQPPASEDISKTIAEICGYDPDQLIWEGYLEKAPTIIKDYINKTLTYFKNTTIMAMSAEYSDDPLIKTFIEQIEKMSALQFLQQINNELDTDSLHIEDNAMIFENNNGKESKLLLNKTFEMPDDSMIPLITQGARATVKRQQNYTNGDIVVVLTPDKELLIRKIVFNEDKVILIPENTKYETKILSKESIEIGGKVESIVVSL